MVHFFFFFFLDELLLTGELQRGEILSIGENCYCENDEGDDDTSPDPPLANCWLAN